MAASDQKIPWRVIAYELILALSLGPIIFWLYILDPKTPGNLIDILFWGLLVSWVQNTRVNLPIKASISQLFIILLAALLTFPLWVPPVLALIFYYNPRLFHDKKYPFYADIFNRLQMSLSTALGALVFYYTDSVKLFLSRDLADGLAILFAGVVFFFANITFVAYVIALTTEAPLTRVWQTNFSWLSLSYLVLTPVALLLARLYTADPPVLGGWGGWSVLLFLVPLYYARFHWDEYVKLKDAFEQTVETLMATIDAKDPHTRLHSERVAAIALDLAKAAGLDAVDREKIRLGARVHDIGKIAIPDQILFKPGKLTKEEYDRIKKHTVIGEALLKGASLFREILPIVRHHHERWDGKGYPDGLPGEKTHLWARIVALADAYEAMTAGRPYRAAKSPEEALQEVLDNAAKQFDPKLVELFHELWQKDPVWRDREVFLRNYSQQPSWLESSQPSSEGQDSKTSSKPS